MTLPRPPRWFVADDILAGRVNLDGYPFRYIYVTILLDFIPTFGKGAYAARIDSLFSAVELLETRGWEVVNFEESARVAYLRRSVPYAEPPANPADS